MKSVNLKANESANRTAPSNSLGMRTEQQKHTVSDEIMNENHGLERFSARGDWNAKDTLGWPAIHAVRYTDTCMTEATI